MRDWSTRRERAMFNAAPGNQRRHAHYRQQLELLEALLPCDIEWLQLQGFDVAAAIRLCWGELMMKTVYG